RLLTPPLLPPFPTRRSSDLIAGHRPEEVAVQPCDELREGRAPPVGQPRFPDVLGRRLRRVEAQRLPPIELEDESEEAMPERFELDRKSTRLNSSHVAISYAV